MKLEKIHSASTWTDSEGIIWCSYFSHADFVSENIGWIVGSGQILHTEDGGKTWVNQFNDQMGRRIVIPRRVFAIDEHRAWLLALADQGSANCYFTMNGGEQWIMNRLSSLIHPNDVFFVGDRFGWIVSDDGEIPAANALIHSTVDGGSNWQSCQLDIKGRPAKVRFVNEQMGFLLQVTANDRRTINISNILITEDGGIEWRLLKSFNKLIINIHLTNNDLFVVGESGFIARFSFVNQVWKRWGTITKQSLNTVASNNHNTVVVGGDSGVLLVSADNGDQWSPYTDASELDNIVSACFTGLNQAILTTSSAAFLLKLADSR